MSRVWKWAAGVTLTVALAAAAVTLALPGYVKSAIEARGSAVLGREVGVARVEFLPRELAFVAHELQVASAAGVGAPPLLSVRRIYLQASLASVWHAARSGAPVLESAEVEAPTVRLTRLAPGRLDIDDIVQRLRPAPDAPPSEPPRFRLRNVRLAQGVLSFDDRVTGRRLEATAIELDLPRLSRLGGDEDEAVESRLSLRLGGQAIELQVRSKPFSAGRPTEAALSVQSLDLAPWWPYVEAGAPALPVRLVRGALGLRLSMQGSMPQGSPMQWTARGEASLSNLAVGTQGGAPLAAVRRLVVPIDELRLPERRLVLGTVVLDGAAVDVRRDAQGRWEAMGLLADAGRGDVAAAPGAEATPGTSATPSSAWQLQVRRVEVSDAQLRWSDASTRPAASYRLDALEATADGLRWPGTEAVKLSLATRIADAAGPAGSMRVSGRASPREASLDVEAAELRLQAASPYLRDILKPSLAGRAQLRGSLQWAAGDEPRLRAQVARAQVDGLAIVEAAPQAQAASVRSIVVEGADVDLLARQARVTSLRVQEATLRVVRDEGGLLNLERWIVADRKPRAPGARPGASRPWRWSLGRADLDRVRLQWIDRYQRPGVPVELKAELARLTLQGMAEPARAPAQLQLSGLLHAPPGSGAPPGRVAARGAFGWAPLAWRGTLEAERLPLHVFEPYYAAQLPVSLAHAELGLRAEVDAAQAEGEWKADARGEVLLADLQVAASASETGVAAGDALLAWEAVALKAASMSLAPRQRPRIEIGQVRVDKLNSRLVVTEQGRFNLTEELGRRAATREADPGAAAQRRPLELLVGSTTIADARIDFHDYFIKPNYSAELTGLNGSIGRISSESQEMASIELRGRAAGTALLEVRGAVNPAVSPPVMDLSARASDLELAPLSPYAGKYVGYAIERGKLSMDVAYRIDADGKLQARNQVVLNQLTFGERIDSPDATQLPVRLAVALLADRNGVIDIDLPISGSINDPQFSIWGIVVKAIGNLLAKAVTAPFALLTGGAGPEQNWVEFDPGTATVASAGSAVIDTVARALRDRPGLRMTVIGSADAAIEREAIQAATFEARLRAEHRRELARAGAPAEAGREPAPLSPAERERLVRRLYAQAPIPDKPRNALGLVRELPLAETEERLTRHVTVTDDTARELAIQRGLAVRDALVTRGLASERLFLGAPKVGAAAGAADGHAPAAGWTPRALLTLETP